MKEETKKILELEQPSQADKEDDENEGKLKRNDFKKQTSSETGRITYENKRTKEVFMK